MKRAIYPGSFDPIHQGHISIVKKGLKIFDEIFVIVTNNPEKKHEKTINERYEEAKKQFASTPNVYVEINESNLTADIANQKGIKFLIRSARNQTDFDYELELAAGNKHLNNSLETILIIPDYSDVNFSSRLMKQLKK